MLRRDSALEPELQAGILGQMVTTLKSVELEAMKLPQEQRLTLAHRLLCEAEPPRDHAVDALWEAEIVRRIDLLDQGLTERHLASDVFKELDQRLGE